MQTFFAVDEALVSCWLGQLQDDWGAITAVADTCTVVVTVITDVCCCTGVTAYDEVMAGEISSGAWFITSINF